MTLVSVLVGAAAICACSIVIGQAVWRLAGCSGWSGLAPPVGLAALVAIALAAVEAPGGPTAGAVALLAATAGALLLRPRAAARRTATVTVVVALLGIALACLPFAAAGRVGTLGVTDNADLAAHLLLADVVGTDKPPAALDPGFVKSYPTGPHSLVTSLRAGLGIELDAGFNALLVAVLALSAVTALALLRGASPQRRIVGALVAGIPYLGAQYTIQSSFKETMLALIVIGWALSLPVVVRLAATRALAILPLAVLAAGAFGIYSFPALGWLGAATLVYGALALAKRRSLPRFQVSRRSGIALVLFVLVLAVVALPMADEAKVLTGAVRATAAGQSTGGNLNAELPAYEVFGAWPSRDLRAFGASDTLLRAFSLLAGLVTLWAGWWWWRRGRIEAPTAALATLAVYAAARVTAKPYYSGKTLAIAAFAVGLMTVTAVAMALPRRATVRRQPPLRLAAAGVGVVFLALFTWSSALGLRAGRVAPAEHDSELRSLVPLLRGSPTLYMGQNDYLPWILRGVPLAFPYSYVAASQVPFGFRADKGWLINRPFDFDSAAPDGLDQFRFAIASRSPYASAPPPNWKPVRRTRSYVVWERRGPTQPRLILGEGGGPGAILDCSADGGRALSQQAGEAGVRPRPIVLATTRLRDPGGRPLPRGEFGFTEIQAGSSAHVRADIPRAKWVVSLQYVSPVAIEVTGPGMRAILPPSLEGPGVFWRAGVASGTGGTVRLRVHPKAAPPLAAFRSVLLGSLALTRAGARQEVVPVRRACGRYVDWYTPASS